MSESEGWKLVPIKPTVGMWVDGFEAVSMFHDTEEYREMAGCKGAAESAKICYAAILAASPDLPDSLLVNLYYAAQGDITQFRIKARKLLGG